MAEMGRVTTLGPIQGFESAAPAPKQEPRRQSIDPFFNTGPPAQVPMYPQTNTMPHMQPQQPQMFPPQPPQQGYPGYAPYGQPQQMPGYGAPLQPGWGGYNHGGAYPQQHQQHPQYPQHQQHMMPMHPPPQQAERRPSTDPFAFLGQ